MIRPKLGHSPLKATLAGVILSVILLVQASAASAATLSEDMVQASKDACVSLAKRRGFTVEQVINAQPAGGDSASVVLKLMKAGEPYEFKCGFSQAIDHFIEPAQTATNQRVAQAPAVAQRQQATATTTQNTPQATSRAEAREEVRRERAVVVERNRQQKADGNVRNDRGRLNAIWLLPLLLLPLAAILFRNREEEATATSKITTSAAMKPAIVEALLRNQDTAIEVRSGAGISHAVTRTLPAGSRVRLSGRYDNEWAELAESGWIQIGSLTADPRASAVKSY